VRTSDALCRTMPPPVTGLLPVPGEIPEGRPPGGGRHHARAVETAVGLGRRTSSGPERLPLDRPEPCGPSGQMSRLLFTFAASAPHPVACCESYLPRQRPASRIKLSSRYTPRVAPRPAPTGKMRLTNFCNRLTKRAPSGLSDSRLRLLHRSLAVAARLVLDHPRPMASGNPPGGASLDGDAPASA